MTVSGARRFTGPLARAAGLFAIAVAPNVAAPQGDWPSLERELAAYRAEHAKVRSLLALEDDVLIMQVAMGVRAAENVEPALQDAGRRLHANGANARTAAEISARHAAETARFLDWLAMRVDAVGDLPPGLTREELERLGAGTLDRLRAELASEDERMSGLARAMRLIALTRGEDALPAEAGLLPGQGERIRGAIPGLALAPGPGAPRSAIDPTALTTRAATGPSGGPVVGGAGPAPDLTGLWEDEHGTRYRLRQIGEELFWSADDASRTENVFYGTIAGRLIAGEWANLPSGRRGAGTLALRVESPDRLVKISSGDDYGASVWTRSRGAR